MRRSILSLMILGLFSACAVGPDYKRPEIDSPDHYRYALGKDDQNLTDSAWWQQFGDPVLNELITSALQENKDVRIAAARVEEYYGRYGATRSQMFPQLGVEATGGRSRASERTVSQAPSPNPYNSVQMDAFASWEIDLFGRLRRQSEAAQAQLLSTEEGRRGTVLSLTASVVNGYISLRTFDRQLEISRSTLDSREKSLALFQKRYKGGVISELELSQVQSEYATALAAVPDAERQVAQQENALSVLLGRNPGPIPRGKSIDELTLLQIPAGLPSELLERRPDLLQAEQNLIAANAQIGAAKAQYFPVISLTGLFGGASTSLNNLFNGPGQVWNFVGNVSMPIFSAGNIAGQVRAAEAQQKQALFTYQKTIQTAFQEVDDGLVGSSKSREQLAAQKKRVTALETYARVSWQRYEGGYSSYLDVLDAQRNLFDAQLQYTQVQQQTFSQLVSLYKALGGGWVNVADQMAVQPTVNPNSTPLPFP